MASKGKKSLRFVTWNTRGIKTPPQKFSNVLSRLGDLEADVAFIQETHIGQNDCRILQNVKGWNVYFTVHSSRSKGVAILIRNDVLFEYICHDEDYSGGYIVLFCHLYGELYTLVNIYNHKEDSIVLGRLKQYLMETAEGVLVVGGDFNTVLHPCFDRGPFSSRHSPFKSILEDFIESLNLRDTWSYKRPAEEGFTRSQNESHSRIDMFFLPEDKLERVFKIKVSKVDPVRDKRQGKSDHDPLILTLEKKVQTEKKNPNVATLLKYLSDDPDDPDKRSGKISGAEILSVIKSLPDSEERRCDTLDMKYYKTHQLSPLTETLKRKYNSMMKNKQLPERFQESYSSGDRQIFNVDYLIFSHILAKRLNMFFTPSFKRKIEANLKFMLTLSFEKSKQEIRWPFLKKAIEELKPSPSTPPPDFSIMKCILPQVQSSDELRSLQPGDPLTNTILNLALNQLQDKVFHFKWKCEEVGHLRDKHHKRKCKEITSVATVCYQRQILRVYTQLHKYDEVKTEVDNFKEESGLKISIT